MTAVRTGTSLSSTYRVHRRPATGDVVARRLVTATALQLPQQHEGQQDDDQEDDGDGDADQDGGVVWLRADGLRPGGLTELVLTGVGSDLNIVNSVLTSQQANIIRSGSVQDLRVKEILCCTNSQFDTKKIDI